MHSYKKIENHFFLFVYESFFFLLHTSGFGTIGVEFLYLDALKRQAMTNP
jgi:hypothetical protein